MNQGYPGSMGQYGGSQGSNSRASDPFVRASGNMDYGNLSNLYKDVETQNDWKKDNITSSNKIIAYQVSFRVEKKLKEHQSLCILGSIPELGDWKEFKYHLIRKGDVWESQQPLFTHSFFFRYKYAIMEDGGTR